MLYLSQLHRWENAVFISTSEHREAEWLGQDHTAAEWRRKDCSPGDYLQITTLLYWSMHFAVCHSVWSCGEFLESGDLGFKD